MIKAIANRKEGKVIILGLSDKNIKMLKKGKPISFNLSELGIKGLEVFIFTGNTEASMAKDLEEFIRPELR